MGDGYITASYNALNQPMAMGSMGLGGNFYWFWHDALGRCVKRWLGNGNGVPTGPITYFYYDGWNLVQEGPNASTADRLYVHGSRVDEIVASPVGGQWYNHHYDARGHCILLTYANSGPSNGTIREQYDYDAFGYPYFYDASGNKLVSSFQSGNRFLFTGREWLKDLRVYDYRHRHYQPELGRFLQPDPIQFEAGDYNLYRYCHNDPVNKSDPDGQMPLTKLTVKGIVKILRTKTAHQLIAKGKNLAAGSKKEAARAVEKSLPNRKVVVHTRDRAGHPPHAQPKPRHGNTSHVSFPRKAAAAVTASAYMGTDSVSAQIIDFFSPLSIGQDVVDVVDAFNEASAAADTINNADNDPSD